MKYLAIVAVVLSGFAIAQPAQSQDRVGAFLLGRLSTNLFPSVFSPEFALQRQFRRQLAFQRFNSFRQPVVVQQRVVRPQRVVVQRVVQPQKVQRVVVQRQFVRRPQRVVVQRVQQNFCH